MPHYVPKDLKHVSYSEFDVLMGKLEIQVRNFLERNHMSIDIIVPLFEYATLPAQRLASSFWIRTVISYLHSFKQLGEGCLKHLLINKERFLETEYRQEVFTPRGVLILDTHTIFSDVPKEIIEELKMHYPNASFLFLSLVYSDLLCDDFPCPLLYCQRSRECLQEQGVLDKLFIFPWESESSVLQNMNAVLMKKGKD